MPPRRRLRRLLQLVRRRDHGQRPQPPIRQGPEEGRHPGAGQALVPACPPPPFHLAWPWRYTGATIMRKIVCCWTYGRAHLGIAPQGAQFLLGQMPGATSPCQGVQPAQSFEIIEQLTCCFPRNGGSTRRDDPTALPVFSEYVGHLLRRRCDRSPTPDNILHGVVAYPHLGGDLPVAQPIFA